MDYRRCTKCGIEKPLDDAETYFSRIVRNNRRRWDARCRICMSEYRREYNKRYRSRQDVIEAKKAYDRVRTIARRGTYPKRKRIQSGRDKARRAAWLQTRKGKPRKRGIRKSEVESRKRWRLSERGRASRRKAYARNKFRHNFKARFRHTLKGGKGGRSMEKMLGYTISELRNHLEKQFVKGMTWENYGIVWHIDHIMPVSSFNLASGDLAEVRACWGLPNLRPLFAVDNIKKNAQRTHLL